MLPVQVGTTGASPSGGGGAQGQQQQEEQEQEQEQAAAGSFTIMGPSRWWISARQGLQGHELVRGVMRQLLTALAAVHGSNVTHRCVAHGSWLSARPRLLPAPARLAGRPIHARTAANSAAPGPCHSSQPCSVPTHLSLPSPNRDVKPENLLASELDPSQPAAMHLTLIDFGSAVDAHSLARLYGRQGPGAGELTLDYAPPECLFGDYWKVRGSGSGWAQLAGLAAAG
jgi:serine/threonine protein kinase